MAAEHPRKLIILLFLFPVMRATAVNLALVPDLLPEPNRFQISLKLENDSMGVGIVDEWDDLRTNCFEYNLFLPPWLITKGEFDIATWRGKPGDQALRTDLLTFSLGLFPLPLLNQRKQELYSAVGIGIQTMGNFAGYFIQSRWHGLMGVTRPLPTMYTENNGSFLYLFTDLVYIHRQAFKLSARATGVLFHDLGFDLFGEALVWFNNYSFEAFVGMQGKFSMRRLENPVLAAITDKENGIWLTAGWNMGWLFVENSWNITNRIMNYGIGFSTRFWKSADISPGDIIFFEIGPALNTVTLNTKIRLRPGFWGKRNGFWRHLAITLDWQNGNMRYAGDSYCNHFEQLFLGSDLSLFANKPSQFFNLYGGISLGLRYNMIFQPGINQAVIEYSSLSLSGKASCGVRVTLSSPWRDHTFYGLDLSIEQLMLLALLSGNYYYGSGDTMINPLLSLKFMVASE